MTDALPDWDTSKLEAALGANPDDVDVRDELERRASIDGEAGTDARAALTRLDEARPPVAAAVAEAAGPHARADAARARQAEAAGDVVPLPPPGYSDDLVSDVVRVLLRYQDRRRRLDNLPVANTQAARMAKLELELGEAMDALGDIANTLNIPIEA